MDPILEKVKVEQQQSFAVKEEILPYIRIGWHFHPEYELTFFTESTGRRFVGDHTDVFGPGDLLLIGPNLPHFMRNDEVYYHGNSHLRIRAVVVHFAPDFLGKDFFQSREMRLVLNMLDRSARGIHFKGKICDEMGMRMEDLLLQDGYERLRGLLDILHLLSQSADFELLASLGFRNTLNPKDTRRVDYVYNYLLKHFKDDIHLGDVARNVNMSPSAFCKFFKKRTGQTFSQTLNEIRIGHACSLFMEKGITVTEACYLSGYNNPSYFYRQFKSITGIKPGTYRKQFVNGRDGHIEIKNEGKSRTTANGAGET